MKIKGWVYLLAISIMVTVFPIALSQGKKTPQKASQIPCKLASQPILIDGLLLESDWKHASQIQLTFDTRGSFLSSARAYARFLWDKTNFYVAIVAKDNDVQSTYKGRDQRLWEEDVLELFIKPNFSSSIYYEFQFSPTNQVFDAYWSKRGTMGKLKEATSWNSNLRSAVHIDGTLNQSKDKDYGWTVEVAIPLDNIKGNKKDLSSWKVAACRYDYDDSWEHPKNTSTAPVSKEGGFHEYEVYGDLIFTK